MFVRYLLSESTACDNSDSRMQNDLELLIEFKVTILQCMYTD